MSYGQIGVIQMIAGFYIWYIVMADNGFRTSELFGLRSDWDSKWITDLEDSYGQQWVSDHFCYHAVRKFFFLPSLFSLSLSFSHARTYSEEKKVSRKIIL